MKRKYIAIGIFLFVAITLGMVIGGATNYFIFGKQNVDTSSSKPSASSVISPLTETVYDRVKRTGIIRCAYIDYPPSLTKDPNTGKPSGGISYKTIIAATNNLGLNAEFVKEVDWKNMIGGLQRDEYDLVVSGIWPNAPRAMEADFSIPLFYSGIGVYVREDDGRRKKYNKSVINNSRTSIATIDGEMSDVLARTIYPDATRVSISRNDFSEMFSKVVDRKADVALAEAYQINKFMEGLQKEHPNAVKLKNIVPNDPIRVLGNTVMFKRGQTEFKSMLNIALEELINSGYIESLIRSEHYEPTPGIFYMTAYPYRKPAKD